MTTPPKLPPLNCDMRAQRWAKEFMESKFAKNLPPEVDESLMLAWFANAIMCGWDNAHWKLDPLLYAARKEAEEARALGRAEGRIEAYRRANIYTDRAYAGLIAAEEEAKAALRSPDQGGKEAT